MYHVGQPASFWVSAVDASGFPATGYNGTVSFASSDGSAILPATHTFTPSDNSVLLTSITFNSPGTLPGAISATTRQTITAIDSANGLSATVAFSILGFAQPVPAMDGRVLSLLAALVAFAGSLVIKSRGLTTRSTGPAGTGLLSRVRCRRRAG